MVASAMRCMVAVLLLVTVLCTSLGGTTAGHVPQNLRGQRAFAAARAIDAHVRSKQSSSSYITIIPNSLFIAPTCKALWEAVNDIRALINGVSRKKKFTIELPCLAGAAPGFPGGSWSTPDYNCYDPTLSPETNGSLSMVFTAPRRATIIVRASKRGGCDLKYKTNIPELYGGAPFVQDQGGGFAFFTFGGDSQEYLKVVTAYVQNIRIRANGTRPGVEVYNGRLLSLKGVDILDTAAVYEASGVLAVDTRTTWLCTKRLPCLMSGGTTYGYDPIIYPGGGGAIGVQAINSFGVLFSSSWVSYVNNTHTYTGGVFFVWKLVSKGVTVSFKYGTFKGNRALAGGCSVGASYRDDGTYSSYPIQYAPKPGLPLSIKLFKAYYVGNLGPAGDYEGVQLCGVRSINTTATPNQEPLPMPFKFKTRVFFYPLVRSTRPPPSPIDGATVEYSYGV